LRNRGFGEFGLELVVASESGVDFLRKCAAGGTATFGLQRIPVKRVVPRLRCIVEDAGLVRLPCRGLDDRLQRLPLVLRPRDQLVEGLDIRLVMFAVMEADGLRRNDGRQRAFGKRMGRERERLCLGEFSFD
jgi:hypothetical protein